MTHQAETSTDTAATPHRARLTLRIDGVDYGVRPLARAELGPDVIRGFGLTRDDAKLGRVRHVVRETIAGQFCSCQHQQYRRAPAGDACKHLAACIACGLF